MRRTLLGTLAVLLVLLVPTAGVASAGTSVASVSVTASELKTEYRITEPRLDDPTHTETTAYDASKVTWEDALAYYRAKRAFWKDRGLEDRVTIVRVIDIP